MTERSESNNALVAERVHIAGSVRWAMTDAGRIIIQFATHEDRNMALQIWNQEPKVVRFDAEVPVVELELPR